MGLPRQEYWSGLPIPSPGELPDPETAALQADSLPLSHWGRLSAEYFRSVYKVTHYLKSLVFTYSTDTQIHTHPSLKRFALSPYLSDPRQDLFRIFL